MQPTLLQAQIRAWFIGLLWFLPFVILIRIADSFGLFVLFGFPVLVAFLAAMVTGPFDLLVIVTCLVPSAYMMLMDFHMQMVHPINGAILGPSSAITLIGSLIPAAVGVGLKRLLTRRREESLPDQTQRRLYFWLGADLALLVFIPSVILAIDVYKISRQPTKEQLAQIEIQKLASPATPNREKIQAMLELQRKPWVQSPEAVSAFKKVFESDSPPVKFAAAVFLLEDGDVTSLSYLEDRLMQSGEATVDAGPGEMQTDWLGYGDGTSMVRFNLGSSLRQVRDPAAIPVLAHLLTSSDVEVRRGAASALRDMDASVAIDDLLPALNDPDPEVRYLVMGALMTATGDPHYPSRDIFHANEAFYLDQWKAWARDRSQPPPRSRPF